MKLLQGKDAEGVMQWMERAAKVATYARCIRAHCGAVIVKDGEVIGEGYNAPPLDNEGNRMCDGTHSSGKPGYDHTCCMHAEWRAIIDALKTHSEQIKGSTLYFVRIDDEGKVRKSGKPYCTVCSRFALDVGIATFVLWHDEGVGVYPTDEYNALSFQYRHIA